jgi:hypothetical protein
MGSSMGRGALRGALLLCLVAYCAAGSALLHQLSCFTVQCKPGERAQKGRERI